MTKITKIIFLMTLIVSSSIISRLTAHADDPEITGDKFKQFIEKLNVFSAEEHGYGSHSPYILDGECAEFTNAADGGYSGIKDNKSVSINVRREENNYNGGASHMVLFYKDDNGYSLLPNLQSERTADTITFIAAEREFIGDTERDAFIVEKISFKLSPLGLVTGIEGYGFDIVKYSGFFNKRRTVVRAIKEHCEPNGTLIKKKWNTDLE